MRIGIDLGGTKIEAVTVDDNGRMSSRIRMPTPANDYAAIVAAIVKLVDRLDPQATPGRSIGIGIPGAISPATGLVKNANTQCLIGRDLLADLQRELGQRVRLENDANCMVLSEIHGGSAAGAATVFGVIIGTGTGGALYLNGALVSGANAIAGEWGHNPVPWAVSPDQTRACYCGRSNCVETFLSGPGLIKSYLEHGAAEVASVEAIVQASERGDDAAAVVLAQYVQQLTRALAVVVNIVDPGHIVLAGGVSNLPGLAAAVEAGLPAACFSDTVTIAVTQARFGDSSGVRGAANLWAVGELADV